MRNPYDLNKHGGLRSAESLWREVFGAIEAKEIEEKEKQKDICPWCGKLFGPACCE